MKAKPKGNSPPCVCGGGSGQQRYAQCCEPLHRGRPAPTAEALMRSRYSAYALGLMDYVSQTWHASTRADDLPREAAATLQWINLRVLAHTPAADGLTATVEFVATYRVGGRAHKLHELSRFVFEGERWWYVDAATDPARDASRPNPQS